MKKELQNKKEPDENSETLKEVGLGEFDTCRAYQY